MSACLFLPYGRCCLTDIELLDKPASAVPKSEVKNSPRLLPPKCVVWELELMPVQVAVENLPSTVGLAQCLGSWASHWRWESLGCFPACARWARSQMPWIDQPCCTDLMSKPGFLALPTSWILLPCASGCFSPQFLPYNYHRCFLLQGMRNKLP